MFDKKSEELKKEIDNHNKKDLGGFIKVTDNPVSTLSSEQKVALNRKGNILFNSGDIDGAARIFKTTGYSDGLIRVGDKLMEEKKSIEALKQYVLAHSKSKAEPVYEKLAGVISSLLKED